MGIDLTKVCGARNPSISITHQTFDVETINGDVYRISIPRNATELPFPFTGIMLYTLYVVLVKSNEKNEHIADLYEGLLKKITDLQLELKAEVYQMLSGTKE